MKLHLPRGIPSLSTADSGCIRTCSKRQCPSPSAVMPWMRSMACPKLMPALSAGLYDGDAMSTKSILPLASFLSGCNENGHVSAWLKALA